MKNVHIILLAVMLAGCRSWYPELNGTYVEDKAATVAYAQQNGLSKPEWMQTYSTGLCQTVVINKNILSKQCQDSRFDPRIRFSRLDPHTFRFRYPYDQKSDVFIFLEDDGIWLTVPGEPEHRCKFTRQEETNQTFERMR